MFGQKKKFPIFMQRDAMQCGPACLFMVARHFGIRTSISRIEDICPHSKEGVSMQTLKKASSLLGIDSAAGRLSVNELTEAPMPLILHWNQNHFVVLYKVSSDGKRFHIADPAKGRYACGIDKLSKHWLTGESGKGVAMAFHKDENLSGESVESELEGAGRPLAEFLNTARRELRKERSLVWQMLVGLFLGSLLNLALPFLMRDIVDVGIRDSNLNIILLILAGECLIVLGQVSIDFIRRWILLHISMKFNLVMVSDFFSKLLRLPMKHFETRHIGDYTQRISDHVRIQNFLTSQALGMVFSAVTFLIFSVALLFLSPMIFLIFITASIIYTVWVMAFLHRRKILDYELFELQSKNQTGIYHLISSIQEIKLQNCENRKRWEWEDLQTELFQLQNRSLKLQQIQESGAVLINELKNILITVISATGVISGNLTLGDMMAIQFIVGQLNSPIEQAVGFIYGFQDIKISADRINDIKARPDEDLETFNPGNGQKDKDGICDISLRNLSFKYDIYSNQFALRNINLEIPSNKVTAIVGESGSGKSTLVKMLLGYYPPTDGSIYIGQTDLSKMNKREWRSRCGCVMQNGIIFSESIRRNIAVDDKPVDEERLSRAIELACLEEILNGLPLGLDTKIGVDGHGLSQGQIQRILIARALYRQPDVYLLDEATNSLDAKNEGLINTHLMDAYSGKTVVIVAHRLSTVRKADRIVVLHKGEIAEEGRHEELMERRGIYYNLVKEQLNLGD